LTINIIATNTKNEDLKATFLLLTVLNKPDKGIMKGKIPAALEF